MPNTKTAKKELRVAERRHARNKSEISLTKSSITKAQKLITSSELDSAKQAVAAAVKILDKAAEKGVIHKNNAARRKSRLMKKLNLAAKSVKPEEPKT